MMDIELFAAMFTTLPMWIQILCIIVLLTMVLVPHIAALTSWKLSVKLSQLLDTYTPMISKVLKVAFRLFAGNYLNAKNSPRK